MSRGGLMLALAPVTTAAAWFIPTEQSGFGVSISCETPVTHVPFFHRVESDRLQRLIDGCTSQNRWHVVVGLLLGVALLLAGVARRASFERKERSRRAEPPLIQGAERRLGVWGKEYIIAYSLAAAVTLAVASL